MKQIGKLTATYLFVLPALLFSCKKENHTNRSPVAKAGPDQTITLPLSQIVLNGDGSSDPDNNIMNYTWTKISGPWAFNISILNNEKKWQVQATNLIEGIYKFELKVTDHGGLISKDTVQVTVMAQSLVPSNLQSFYFSDLKWEISPFDNGVKLIVPAIANRNANEVRAVATTDQATCNGPWGICYRNDLQTLQKDGIQAGVIYYRIENASVVLYIKSQPFNSYYQSAQYAVLIDF